MMRSPIREGGGGHRSIIVFTKKVYRDIIISTKKVLHIVERYLYIRISIVAIEILNKAVLGKLYNTTSKINKIMCPFYLCLSSYVFGIETFKYHSLNYIFWFVSMQKFKRMILMAHCFHLLLFI